MVVPFNIRTSGASVAGSSSSSCFSISMLDIPWCTVCSVAFSSFVDNDGVGGGNTIVAAATAAAAVLDRDRPQFPITMSLSD